MQTNCLALSLLFTLFLFIVLMANFQMRNLILSAFPRNMRLPDPFTPNLKVDMLPEISLAPRVLTNYVSTIQPVTFKKVTFSHFNLISRWYL